jgi:hypothetical protein
MNFDEVLAQVLDLLQRQGRVAYRALKIRFNLDDEFLEGIKDEIIHARRLAVDEAGKVLVWTGASAAAPPQEQRADRTTPSARSSTANDLFQAEHRQLTVVFCDLVDSTRLARQLGPEDYLAVVLAYQEAVIAAMQPWGGYVAQYLGDGLMLYFGWPQGSRLADEGMGLSRLWQQQGKWAEAYELLAPVYGWFTEGFDTADLQAASVLLQELV